METDEDQQRAAGVGGRGPRVAGVTRRDMGRGQKRGHGRGVLALGLDRRKACVGDMRGGEREFKDKQEWKQKRRPHWFRKTCVAGGTRMRAQGTRGGEQRQRHR